MSSWHVAEARVGRSTRTLSKSFLAWLSQRPVTLPGPVTLEIERGDGGSIKNEVISVEKDRRSGVMILRTRTAGAEGEGGFVVTGDRVYGRIENGESRLEIRPGGDSHVLESFAQTPFRQCGLEESRPARPNIRTGNRESGRREASNSSAVIDLVAGYTPQAREVAGGADAITGRIRAAISDANQIFANSRVPVRLSLVGTQEVEYDEGGRGGSGVLAPATA